MRKLLLSILLLFSSIAWCNQRYQGTCQQSGVTVLAGLNSTTTSPLTYPGATVTVTVVGGGLATIFSDNLGTPLANPFTASSSDATFSFYAANSASTRYTVTCSGTGIPTISINPDALLFDPAVATFGTGAFSGNVTVGGTLGVTGPTTLSSTLAVTGASTFCIESDYYVAGSSCYATIQAAITAAGTTGTVLIPANYAGADSYTNANTVPVIDLRNQQFGVWQWIRPSRPTTDGSARTLPLGNDMAVGASGAADLHLRTEIATTTSTTSVGAPGTQNITVGNTANFYTGASIVIGRYGSSEETIASGNWSIVNGTTINATFAKSHTQPYSVDQRGVVMVDSWLLRQMEADNTTVLQSWQELGIAGQKAVEYDVLGLKQFKSGVAGDGIPRYYGNGGAIIQYGSSAGTGTTGNFIFRNNDIDNGFIAQLTGSTGQWLMSQISSTGANPAALGFLQLTKTDQIRWRNNINNADLSLSINGSDQLVYSGNLAATDFIGTIGVTTPLAGHFTTASATGQITSTLATGTAPLSITSTTPVANLTVSNCGATCAITQPTISTGVSQGSGHKHQRFGTLCTTANVAGATCTTAVTWTAAFADANYTVSCTGVTQTNVPTLSIESIAGAGFTIRISAVTANAATFATVNCIADHD